MNKITLWNESEYHYSAACGFIPNMRLYFHEDEKVRPCIVIAPGGGYSVVSPSEGEIVAKKFYEMGYQTAVVTYTTNLLQMIPLKLQPMQDLMRAIRYIRKHAEELHVDNDKIMLCGFSAGAHACGSVAVHWQEFEESETGEPYTLEQTFALEQAVNDGTFPVPEEAKQALNEMVKMFTGQTEREKQQANEEVKQWPRMADEWIKNLIN